MLVKTYAAFTAKNVLSPVRRRLSLPGDVRLNESF
jgi:hypothetical protein